MAFLLAIFYDLSNELNGIMVYQLIVLILMSLKSLRALLAEKIELFEVSQQIVSALSFFFKFVLEETLA